MIPGDLFHRDGLPVYTAPLGWAVNNQAAHMATVVYDPAHENPAEATPERRGSGRDVATWVFSEEEGSAEGLLRGGMELFIDARLDPHASIGLHRHTRTEEVYYMLEGTLAMTTVAADGREATVTLHPGDAHLVRPGQAHFGTAGPGGARFITVAARIDSRPSGGGR